MPNRLAKENSPYLLQHAENPVDWFPWGSEALQKARQENKPIFLSIGYSACHWCHVMAHESFEDETIAAFMNDHFVNIKVDREERPDLDSIYMNAVTALTGQGGWPMSVFLTPEGQPFFGGTYFPPVHRYNMPSFMDVLASVSSAWKNQHQQVVQSSQKITEYLHQSNYQSANDEDLRPENLDKAVMTLAQNYDWKFGGWGNAPKFPQPMTLEFLWRKAVLGDHLAKDMATHALISMAKGGMYDILGGGFARYSTDNEWMVPHFEKMLYDNAQLALSYLHGYLITGDTLFRRVCEGTLGFIQRELTHPQGGFYSSLDADSEGQEGKYYTWSMSEIQSALPESSDQELFITAYNISEDGNIDGANILRQSLSTEELAKRYHLSSSDIEARLDTIRALMLAKRQARIPPATDDKILTAWNALACIAFSEAGRYLNNPDYKSVAIRNAQFLLSNLHPVDRLLRSWRNGQARHNAYLEDYAGLILACLSLYQSDPDAYWFKSAIQLADEMLIRYDDPQGAFFDSPDDQEALIVRPKDFQDNATPCGNSLAATALLQLASYTGRGEWRDKAEAMLKSIQGHAIRYPTSFAFWLCAIDFALTPAQEIALIGDTDDPHTQALAAVVWSKYRPHLVFACSNLPIPNGSPSLLEDRILVNDLPTAYICHNFVCKLPVNDPDALHSQLRN